MQVKPHKHNTLYDPNDKKSKNKDPIFFKFMCVKLVNNSLNPKSIIFKDSRQYTLVITT